MSTPLEEDGLIAKMRPPSALSKEYAISKAPEVLTEKQKNEETVQILTQHEKMVPNVGIEPFQLPDCRCPHVDGPSIKPLLTKGTATSYSLLSAFSLGGPGGDSCEEVVH
jgi:mannitol/fructose-specific phosphotransferase system IIA component (Ntr-type)